jgi:hypothetical protein
MKGCLRTLMAGNRKKIILLILILFAPVSIFAAAGTVPSVGPIRVEFIIFGLILLGVAFFLKTEFCVDCIWF